jgi:hypothetical protein
MCTLERAPDQDTFGALWTPHLQGFKPEERGPDEFVIFCEAPFLSKTPVQGQGKS